MVSIFRVVTGYQYVDKRVCNIQLEKKSGFRIILHGYPEFIHIRFGQPNGRRK